jgi:hypothetical protein
VSFPILRRIVDERFLEHRRRSTSLGGIISALLAIGIFEYRYYAHGVWSWDLLAVVVTFVGVKLGAMIWYVLKD